MSSDSFSEAADHRISPLIQEGGSSGSGLPRDSEGRPLENAGNRPTEAAGDYEDRPSVKSGGPHRPTEAAGDYKDHPTVMSGGPLEANAKKYG